MLNLVSILIGLPALIAAVIAFFPLLGWAYWFVLPVALVGFVIGLLSRERTGQTINLVVLVVGGLRLVLGGGLI